MMDVLFHTFSPIIIHLIIGGEILIFCHVNVTFKLEENLENLSNVAHISNILYS